MANIDVHLNEVEIMHVTARACYFFVNKRQRVKPV